MLCSKKEEPDVPIFELVFMTLSEETTTYTDVDMKE